VSGKAGLLTLVAFALPAVGGAQCLATVDTVLIEARGVSDGGRGLEDLLHIRTRPGVIRRTVLFRPGDCFSAARAAEAERALWGLGVFRAVKVDTVRVASGRLALRVATADGWSARPVADYARTASRTSWEAGFIDANFLGTAGQLFTSYRSTPDRDWVAVSYSTRHLLFPGSFIWVGHYALSNGRVTAWSAGLPFREAAARFSAMIDGEIAQEQYLIFGEQTVQAESRGRASRLRANVSYAPFASTKGYARLWAAARWREESWAPNATTPYVANAYTTAGAGVELAAIRYRTSKRVNTIGRPEWFDLSPWVRLGVWAAPKRWGYADERAGTGVELQSRLAAGWPSGHAVLHVYATGGWGGTPQVLDSGQARVRLTVVARRGNHNFVVHGDYGEFLGVRPWGLYDLWLEQRGPRLFPPHTFAGNRIRWAVVEDRYVVRESVAGLVGVGIAPFVELAHTRALSGEERSGGDAGLALRLVPLRFAASDVTEFALGYRFGPAARGTGWALGVKKGFWF
jgi:hypothetical protein